MVRFRGPQARTALATLLEDSPPTISYCSCKANQGLLTVRPDYEHLGSLYAGKGHPHSEIQRRFQLCRPLSRLLLTSILRKLSMQQRAREMLYRSLVNSKLLYGSATWQQMNIASMIFWVTHVLRLYRRLVPNMSLQQGVHQLDILPQCSCHRCGF